MTETIEGSSTAYALTYQPDNTSFTVRENLVDILQRELLGPVHGPDEVLPFSPRSHYLVGYIAPVKITPVAAAGDGAEEADDERGELAEARSDAEGLAAGRGVPAFAADDDNGTDAADEDAEDRAPKQGLMIPASMGLRFQVPADLASFTVTATWGTYEAVKTDQVTKAGRTVYHYQRTPIEFRRDIAMASLQPGHTATVALREAICLRIDRYDDPDLGRVLVEIALCNDQETPSPIPLSMWMFQTELRVDAGGAEAFLPVRDVLEQDLPEHDDEVRLLNLQYRNRLEYAIGRTCSVDWTVRDGARRASAVQTTWLPVTETPQTRARAVEGALLFMDALAHVTPEQLRTGLQPLIAGYGGWLDEQAAAAAQLPAHLRPTADEALHTARQAHQRLQAGLDHIAGDAEALRCFRFMNQVMREQRLASQVATLRATSPELSIAAARTEVDGRGEKAASWRPFQLAFILMQLGALTDPAAADRSAKHLAQVELLFFPTGGGKTEAYLGLAAYTFAIRRRQGVVESTDGALDGRDGVAVLMRYTLRLLTSQQFQRATALICAAELARRADEQTWGTQPFRIGLWVGTDVSPKRFEEAEEQLARANEYGAAYRLTVLQVQRCPWCGTPIHAAHVKADKTLRRVFVYCGDELADCPFAKGGSVPDGLPVLTVDEEIYRLTPAFVIATVDKFARLAREGEAAALFGYVGRRCARHGYVHPDYRPCDIKTSHPAANGYPAATVAPVGRLRPPDLIIQDELHLITGALGTSVGLFEVAVETLASWEQPDGKPVRPLIVASTATVRNAGEQVRGLYGRRVAMFPPQVLDVADTYFSRELPVSRTAPGRRYLGVSAQGVRLSSTEIRVAEVLLSAGQLLFDRSGAAADPYMTLVGYFNATRELAGMARYLGDDVQSRVKSPRKDSGFPRRLGAAYGQLNTGELTARIASSKIGETLDQLGFPFDPDYDTTAANKARVAAARDGKKVPVRKEEASPFDAVLATSMLQVGVDVQRLGLMLVVGQPKNTAEYIQASSRVGRDEHKPGLVVTLGNWARPRDLAHFEQFRHYHETFYAQVEALSVTPFSPTSLDRGIDGLLVSAARVLHAHLDDGLSPEQSAGRVIHHLEAINRIVERLITRIQAAGGDEAVGRAKNLLINLVDQWTKRAGHASQGSQTLVYERTGSDGRCLPLLVSPENSQAGVTGSAQAPFVVANSMREVQPEINVLVSPIKDRLFARPPEGTPAWDEPVTVDAMLHDATDVLDPLTDSETGQPKNRAKVGSARPSSLLYTYGPGAIMDLPGFSVMPAGLDDWEPIWKRRQHIPTIIEPRLLNVTRLHLGPQVDALRPFPWQPKAVAFSQEGTDLGVPARVFPQWLRCTGCDYLGPLTRFSYTNTHPFRPDLAEFTHDGCPGRGRHRADAKPKKKESPAVPAPHLLTCANGHLDEFPYTLWVHRGRRCPKAAEPDLKMVDTSTGKSVGAIIVCPSCGARRGMAEAQGRGGNDKLPQKCRGRHPHLNAFYPNCKAQPSLIMMGASNLWFAFTQSIIVLPRDDAEKTEALADRLRAELGVDQIKQFADQLAVIRALAAANDIDVTDVSDTDLTAAVNDVLAPPESEEQRGARRAAWDPIDLLVPEWRYLQKPELFRKQSNTSGLMVTEKQRVAALPEQISRVVAIDKMKKVNAFLGFTRLDQFDRADDLGSRLAQLTRNGGPTWVPATEDRGEGIFIQLDLTEVQEWESHVARTLLWTAHKEAHRRNFRNRFSDTSKPVNPDTRLPAPRYWLLHTFAHVLIREMAMSCGYGAASLTERIYGWPTTPQRDGAAGLLICTTASDSEGTLGGLVALAEPDRLAALVNSALRRATRCSSDPVCAMRTPSNPEDFLHGAACHCCCFASETSCEKANRFLDRRFLLMLASADGETVPGFFGSIDAR